MSSGRTVRIEAPNGAKVRTVASKTYYAVAYGEETMQFVHPDPFERGVWMPLDPPRPYARVLRRSDSVDAARAAARKAGGGASVYRVRYVDGKPAAAELYRYEGGAYVAGPDVLRAVGDR